MSSGGRCVTADKRKEVASASKKVASGARRKSEYVIRIPITPSIPTPSPSPSPSTMNLPSTTNSIPSPSIRLSQPSQRRPSNPSPLEPKRMARRTSVPIIMVPTPGLRHSPRDTPQSSPVLGSSSQPAPPGPTPNDPHDDMDEDSTEAYPIGLLPDLPPGWIMPTCKGFFPSKVASKNITKTLKSVFRHPVTSYFQIDESVRNQVFFERFRTLLTKFNHSDHLEKQEKSKQNRASSKGGSVHIGGSVNHAQHAQDMREKLKQTHSLGGEWKEKSSG
ncbi:hypothetical protein RIF29_32876 [Crotalaria pallida]|uniref:Uncharacterized protein n=1 Tax=Crotalaria pallida TaxID=3830 RepID=A0AAN9E7R1_CROPI